MYGHCILVLYPFTSLVLANLLNDTRHTWPKCWKHSNYGLPLDFSTRDTTMLNHWSGRTGKSIFNHCNTNLVLYTERVKNLRVRVAPLIQINLNICHRGFSKSDWPIWTNFKGEKLNGAYLVLVIPTAEKNKKKNS